MNSSDIPTEAGSGNAAPTSPGIRVRAGNAWLEIPAGRVLEVAMVPERIAAVPGAPTWLGGLANSRGRLITLVDLGARRTGSPTETTPESRLVVVAEGPHLYGLLAEEAELASDAYADERVDVSAMIAGLGSSGAPGSGGGAAQA